MFGAFSAKELFTRSIPAPDEHFLSDKVISALNYLAVKFGKPNVTSTFRTKAHEIAMFKTSFGYHVTGHAIDFQWPDKNITLKIINDIENRGEVFKELRKLGIRGFGIYNTFIHLDARPDGSWKNKDSYGDYAFWDERTEKKNFVEQVIAPFNQNEDGAADTNNFIYYTIIAVIIYFLAKLFLFKK